MQEFIPIAVTILTVALFMYAVNRKGNHGPVVSTINQKKILYFLMGIGIIAMIIVFVIVSQSLFL